MDYHLKSENWLLLINVWTPHQSNKAGLSTLFTVKTVNLHASMRVKAQNPSRTGDKS